MSDPSLTQKKSFYISPKNIMNDIIKKNDIANMQLRTKILISNR